MIILLNHFDNYLSYQLSLGKLCSFFDFGMSEVSQ